MDCKCVRDRTPSPRPIDPRHGGLNQQCNEAPLAPCNNDDLEGVFNPSTGLCTCEPVSPRRGGLNQQCNEVPLAPCNNDDLKGVFNPSTGMCTCESTSPRRGEANGRCNRAPLPACNHANLEAQYERLLPSGESCTCVYLLGASIQDVDENSTGPKLGRSHTGDIGEKCNTRGSPCNCHREPCDQVQPDYSSGQCMCMLVTPVTP